jgi:hypothetical protein
LLQHVLASQGHHQATINWSNHCTEWAHIPIYLHAIIACHCIQVCTLTLPSSNTIISWR